ncbi:YfjI family protein [Phytohabitans sp. ZYX-F-186]|uniref:YfjI family protein n=1 Tax=Phytohabitans maris TaxID=3071409 RepID=A0ABU0ZV02_9ACTN|nr:YfjI family protein [Phytohabitans sp. ZYX-F-186]MDQ7910778.1 YfjI family protein [Phytohabitans sp. ZYX-F-186]
MTNDLTPGSLDHVWEEPLPLGWRTDLPPFPGLPGLPGEYTEALATATQTPLDLPGSVALGVLCACIGGRVRVRARAGWVEPTNAWIVPVLLPGARKSPVVEACTSSLMDAEDVLRESIADKRRNDLVEKEAGEKRAQQLLAVAAKKGDRDALDAAQEAAKKAEEIQIPVWPQLTIDDSTPEALVSVLAEQGGRVAAISAEAGVFEALTGRYAKKANLDAVLKAHAGDTIRVTRQLREPQLVRRPALTLVASIQPYALREMVDRADFAGRGLLARCLWALPTDNVGWREIGAPPVPDELAEQWGDLVRRLAIAMATATAPVVVSLSGEAVAAHIAYERRIEAMLRPNGPMGAPLMRGWGSKLAGATLRIAGAIHAATAKDIAAPISGETMAAAVNLAEYYRAHAAVALRPGEDAETTNARSLIEWLITHSEAGRFRSRDIQRGGPSQLRQKAALAPVLARLLDLGWIRPATTVDSRADTYELHPEAQKHLDACDTGDSCDSDEETAGQGLFDGPTTVSRQLATPATDQPSVANRRSNLRHARKRSNLPLTSEDTVTVAAVAGVATECPVCSWPFGSTGHEINCGGVG